MRGRCAGRCCDSAGGSPHQGPRQGRRRREPVPVLRRRPGGEGGSEREQVVMGVVLQHSARYPVSLVRPVSRGIEGSVQSHGLQGCLPAYRSRAVSEAQLEGQGQSDLEGLCAAGPRDAEVLPGTAVDRFHILARLEPAL
ncbi:hypothetical protein emb_1c0162 [Coriobacteriaceae bacterium EMTCatB1]|nr:hypothetical protein emb_1c0162 [Coriobacteriaceae bacterium EMTCatB1]